MAHRPSASILFFLIVRIAHLMVFDKWAVFRCANLFSRPSSSLVKVWQHPACKSDNNMYWSNPFENPHILSQLSYGRVMQYPLDGSTIDSNKHHWNWYFVHFILSSGISSASIVTKSKNTLLTERGKGSPWGTLFLFHRGVASTIAYAQIDTTSNQSRSPQKVSRSISRL